MSTLKSLVARSNEGLSFRKKSKQGFGLGDFLAATTEQMLMTRGGYGSSVVGSSYISPGDPGGSSSSDVSNAVNYGAYALGFAGYGGATVGLIISLGVSKAQSGAQASNHIFIGY